MRKNISRYASIIFCLLLLITSNVQADTTPAQTAKINDFIKMLQSSSSKTRINAAKYITRSGITDRKLYDIINEKLLAGYSVKNQNPNHVDEMSWMCKALAASGSITYAPTLQKIIDSADNEKLKRYAAQSLSLIHEYEERNRILNDSANMDPELSPEINKYINMLRSDNIALKRDAAKSIYRRPIAEKKLFEVLSEELLKGYKNPASEGKNYSDAMSWMCKALGSSGMKEYRKTLAEIVENSSNDKIARYARQGLKMLE